MPERDNTRAAGDARAPGDTIRGAKVTRGHPEVNTLTQRALMIQALQDDNTDYQAGDGVITVGSDDVFPPKDGMFPLKDGVIPPRDGDRPGEMTLGHVKVVDSKDIGLDLHAPLTELIASSTFLNKAVLLDDGEGMTPDGGLED